MSTEQADNTIQNRMRVAANGLQALWYTVDDDTEHGCEGMEDADGSGRRFGVSRRDVRDFVIHSIVDTDGPESLWDWVNDDAGSAEIEDRHYGPTIEAAYEKTEAFCRKEGELVLGYFISAFTDPNQLSDERYYEAGTEVARALGVDTSEVDADYWDTARKDDVLAWDAAVALQEENTPEWGDLEGDAWMAWMELARQVATDRGEDGEGMSSEEAEALAEELYGRHDGVLPENND